MTPDHVEEINHAHRDRDSDWQAEVRAAGPRAGPELEADKFRSTTTIATRVVGPQAGLVAQPDSEANTSHGPRPTFKLSLPVARAAATLAVSRVPRPPSNFVPLNFEVIRQGFLEGGVKSTGNSGSTSSTSF